MITDRNLSTDMWTSLRACIVATAPTVTDGTVIKTASIRGSYNDQTPSRPQIIIYPITPSETKDVFNAAFGSYEINVAIDCRHSTSLGVDQLRDQVSYALSSTNFDGAELQSISSDYDFAEVGDAKYHINAMSIVYTKD